MHIRIYQDKTKNKTEFRWSLKSDNNKTIADSAESYTTTSGVREAVKRFQELLKDDLEVKDETRLVKLLSYLKGKGKYKTKE